MDIVPRRIAVISLPGPGEKLAVHIAAGLDAEYYLLSPDKSLSLLLTELFPRQDNLVLVMASGIAVRILAPFLYSKLTDPGVVVVDRAAYHVISLVGGHEGKANQLAYDVASLIGADPVVTTGSEVDSTLALGLGYRRGTKAEEIMEAVQSALQDSGRELMEVKLMATAFLKWKDAEIRKAAHELGLLLRFFAHGDLDFATPSGKADAAVKWLGIQGVSEQCAMKALSKPELILPRQIYGKVTVAIAAESWQWWESAPEI